MLAVTFLHISDTHFPSAPKDSYQFDKVVEALLNTLRKRAEAGLGIDLIFFTGDLADKGKNYRSAPAFFDELLAATGLTARVGKAARQRLFIVPGNHDVDRQKTRFLERSLKSQQESDIFFSTKSSNRRQHFARFKAFAQFHNSYFRGIRRCSAEQHWFAEQLRLKVENSQIRIGVVGLNSAWFSQDDKDQSQLWIGERTCRLAYDELKNKDIPEVVFTLHHHPFDWLHPLERERVKGLISRHSDFDLFGHMHESVTESVSGPYGSVLRFQAGALFDESLSVKRSFIGKIDLNSRTVKMLPLSYVDNIYDIWTVDTTVYPESDDHEFQFELPTVTNHLKVASKSSFSFNRASLRNYFNRLQKRLDRERVDRFINLGLDVPKSEEPLAANLRQRNDPSAAYTIFEIAELFPDRKIALVGEPGAGKTTLLAVLLKDRIKSRKAIPVFVRMGLHNVGESLIDLFDLKDITSATIEQLLTRGRFLIVFDGVNECPSESVDEVFQELISFIKQYPANQYFLSCRTSEFPDWVHDELTEVMVLPVSMEEVERQFAFNLGTIKAQDILDKLSLQQGYMRLKELCQNPLLLAMMLSLYKGSKDENVEVLSSRALIYEKFLQRLNLRERKKRRPTRAERAWDSGLKQEVLSFLGYEMQQEELVYVSEDVLQRWIADALSAGTWDLWWKPDDRPTVQFVFRNIVGRPPIKGIVKDPQEPRYYAFLHQSFGEYYAAVYLKAIIEKDNRQVAELDHFILDESRRQWEVVTLLCGLLPNAELLISFIKRRATELRRQSLLVLAGRCVRDASHISQEDADDIRIRLIDAFKYWDIPFDYDLICAIKETGNRQSDFFPARLAEDATRFTIKYAQVIPVELRETSLEALLRYLSAEDPSLIIDAAYTLSKRRYDSEPTKRRVVHKLLAQLDSAKGHVREQLIVALKELGPADALPALLKIITNDSEGPEARAYALNGLGIIGELSAVDPIIEYLLDHSNPYRDSASWSLQRLGKIALAKDAKLAKRIKKTYMKALLNETNDQEGKYAKGNIVYSLSALSAVEFSDEIVNWIKTQTEPYVIEDGINAIGVLGGRNAAATVAPFLRSDDPVIRMKAAEALGRLGYTRATEDLERLTRDRFSIVRDSATDALKNLRGRDSKKRSK